VDDWVWILIIVGGGLAVVALLPWGFQRWRRQHRSARLRARFGPEYEHAVRRYGREHGERHLEAVLDSHDQLELREVSAEERDAVLQSWLDVQTMFVETPVTAVHEADRLVYRVLRERGYPLETVDDRATALSVDKPALANRYREANLALAYAENTSRADVNKLRDALLTYRDLLHDLVGASVSDRVTAPPPTSTPTTTDATSTTDPISTTHREG
jgi:hypothetical protein